MREGTQAPHSKSSAEDLQRLVPNKDPNRQRKDEIFVDEAVLESFPASDVPSWTPTHAGGPLPEPAKIETPRELRALLRRDVEELALAIGDRNDQSIGAHVRLRAAADYIANSFLATDHPITRLPLPQKPDVENLEVVIRGVEPGDEVVVGAHYDSVVDGPGADDDASGIAVLLALGRILKGRRFAHNVRLVAFTNEEPPHTRKKTMGSRAYAKRLRKAGVRVRGMLSLDCVGFFTPNHRDVAVVGNIRSRNLVTEVRDGIRLNAELPVRGVVLPGFLPLVSSSDHRSFWKQGWPAVMVTDTGPLRYPRYHRKTDLPKELNYDAMADLVFGLASAVTRLAGGEGQH